jgi:hypothetical protein
MPSRTCPRPEMLAAYNLGCLAAGDLPALEQHLLDCPACAGRLQELDDHDDPLLRGLRARQAEEPADAACERLVKQVAALGPVRPDPPLPSSPPRPSPFRRPSHRCSDSQGRSRVGEGGSQAIYQWRDCGGPTAAPLEMTDEKSCLSRGASDRIARVKSRSVFM